MITKIKKPLKKPDQVDQALKAWRKNRFRIMVCIDGSDASYEGLHFAAQLGKTPECDIILTYVRQVDQGMRTGGLQARVARENMMEWGIELPGIEYLEKGLEILRGDGIETDAWKIETSHRDVWGDPLGDNKVEYRHEDGRSIVLKLKTSPDEAGGILDQYELGPYNLIIMGEPGRWRGGLRSNLNAGVAQKVAMLAPCSVLIARQAGINNTHGHLIATSGSHHSLDAVRRHGVLAKYLDEPVTLLSIIDSQHDKRNVEESLAIAGSMLEGIGTKVHEAIVEEGDPAKKILEIGNHYSLIGVADTGKSWLKRFILGSVSFNVMGQAKTSVMNVR